MPRAKLLQGQQGSILLELLSLVAVLLLSGSFIFLQGDALWQHYYKQQVRLMGQLLAGDLRQLQSQTLFKTDTVNRDVRPNSTSNGYYFTENGVVIKKQLFTDYHCADVYFESKIAKLFFGVNGAPSTNGYYKLRHKKLSGFAYRIDVQPITGRVLAYDVQ